MAADGFAREVAQGALRCRGKTRQGEFSKVQDYTVLGVWMGGLWGNQAREIGRFGEKNL